MYQLRFDNGVDVPIVTKTKLNEADARWWADRLRELQNKFSVNIVHETTDWLYDCHTPLFCDICGSPEGECTCDEDWILENLLETTGPRTERPGAEYGVEV